MVVKNRQRIFNDCLAYLKDKGILIQYDADNEHWVCKALDGSIGYNGITVKEIKEDVNSLLEMLRFYMRISTMDDTHYAFFSNAVFRVEQFMRIAIDN